MSTTALSEAGAVPTCEVRRFAVVPVGGHGPAVATVTAICLHEHLTVPFGACRECLDRRETEGLCCSACELTSGQGINHCCPLTLKVHETPEGLPS